MNYTKYLILILILQLCYYVKCFNSNDHECLDLVRTASMNCTLKIEHVHIYNYELNFLARIGATKSDIESRKRVMHDLEIPIM